MSRKEKKETATESRYRQFLRNTGTRISDGFNTIGQETDRETLLRLTVVIIVLCGMLGLVYLYVAAKGFGWI